MRAGLALCCTLLLATAACGDREEEAYMQGVSQQMLLMAQSLTDMGFDHHPGNKIDESDEIEVSRIAAGIVDQKIDEFEGAETEASAQYAFVDAMKGVHDYIVKTFPTRRKLKASHNAALYTLIAWLSSQDESLKFEFEHFLDANQ